MRSPMSSTAAIKTTSMGTTSKARPPAGGKASNVSAVIEATERPGACSRLKVRSRRPMEPRTSAARSASVERVAMIEVAMIEVAVVEVVAIDDRSAVRDVGVVVVDRCSAVPVVSPVMPAPSISSEKAEPEADSKSNPRSGQEYPRHRIPTRIRDDRLTVHEPGVIGRHVDHFRVSRFDDDCVALSCYLLLFIAIQVAGLAGLLTHGLDGVRHCLLLIGVCVAKRGSPREVLVHVFKNRGKLGDGLHTRVPGLFVDFLCQFFTLEIGMTLNPTVRLDNLRGIGGGGENLRNEGVRVQGDRRDELLQLLRGMLHGRRWLLFVGLASRSERFGLRGESHKRRTEK